MMHRRTYGEVTWVDIISPTQAEIREVMREFTLDPLIAEELLAPSVRTRVDVRETYFYLVLHFPAFKHLNPTEGMETEIDFIVGKKWILTARYDEMDPLNDFSKMFEVEQILDHSDMGKHAGYVFYHMLVELYRTLRDELVHITSRLDSAEERIFQGYEKEMVVALSQISRDLLNYSQALDSHATILSTIESPGVALFGYTYARHVRSVFGEYERLIFSIKSCRASLVELRETNNALLTTKQNEIMKVFTILAFVTFPLTLFSSLFGMNTNYTPIVGHQFDFWIIVSIMIGVATLFFSYFKYKKWL